MEFKAKMKENSPKSNERERERLASVEGL